MPEPLGTTQKNAGRSQAAGRQQAGGGVIIAVDLGAA